MKSLCYSLGCPIKPFEMQDWNLSQPLVDCYVVFYFSLVLAGRGKWGCSQALNISLPPFFFAPPSFPIFHLLFPNASLGGEQSTSIMLWLLMHIPHTELIILRTTEGISCDWALVRVKDYVATREIVQHGPKRQSKHGNSEWGKDVGNKCFTRVLVVLVTEELLNVGVLLIFSCFSCRG